MQDFKDEKKLIPSSRFKRVADEKDTNMPQTLESNSELPLGDIQFYDYTQPTLVDGDYVITITPQLSLTNATPDSKDLDPTQQSFTVSGPRFELPSSDIHAMIPALNSSGQFGIHLPHIVLNKRATPWERPFNTASPTPTPWMALLVLTADELAPPASGKTLDSTGCMSGTVQEFLTGASDTLTPSDFKATTAEQSTSCHYVRLPSTSFKPLMPQLSELPYLAHCRQINTGDKEILGLHEKGWFSVIVANRFPQSPGLDEKETKSVKNVAHLISLEGWENYLSGSKSIPSQYQYFQLLSLASWSFNCLTDPKENFATLFKPILSQSQSIEGVPSSLLRIVLDAKQQHALPTEANHYFANGYALLPYATRTGEKTVAWYRGPFTPFAVTSVSWFPQSTRSGESLMIYDQQMGGI